ncbi:MAG: ATP-binding cassette domain-containing protein [Sumerlaeia bacterium]
MITVNELRKSFFVHKKAPGFWGSVKSLVRREQIEKEAVRGVSFEIGEGEIVGLLGANGAGKTTVVKMLAGIIHPSGGEARVLGHVPHERDDRFRSQIALIMGQKAQLWWDLPAADCFLLLKEIYRIPDERFRENLDHLTDVLGVHDYLNVQVRRLSLGERMKMELIAALLHDPRVVFLDEPTIGLDLSAQRAIREFLTEYQQTRRPATILTSHYMEDIEHLCRRIIIIREGELVYDGLLEDVMRTYAPRKVVTATLAEGADGRVAEAGLGELGEVTDAGGGRVRLLMARSDVARNAARLMDVLPVIDLTIEEPDVGQVIENIMTARRS